VARKRSKAGEGVGRVVKRVEIRSEILDRFASRRIVNISLWLSGARSRCSRMDKCYSLSVMLAG
jgi:hypothetical protein